MLTCRVSQCDGALPACSNCKNAGIACADGASARMRGLPRAHLADLRNRIAWLESIIKERCPDIDLSQDAPAMEASESDAEDLGLPDDELTNREANSRAHTDRDATNENIVQSQGSSQPVGVPLVNDTSRPAEIRRDIAIDANTSTHQIGLIALGSGQDARYIGPSSGYFLARVLLQSPERTMTTHSFSNNKTNNKLPLPCDLIDSIQGPLPLPSRQGANFLCESYFNMIHVQYPILHRPTFMNMLEQMHQPSEPDPVVAFQVFMVLAIGASVCPRVSRPGILSDSYGISAMRFFDQINVQNSLQGLQCLLLMSLYAMHNPSAKLSVWYLNYHCIAALLDLGLQRKIDVSSGVSLFEQEMRTRLFWSVYTLDRTIATTVGRPIGLRDEACELRLPQDISDDALSTPGTPSTVSNGSHMQFSIHLFKLARINSEIKYIANSINRGAPPYALPFIADYPAWQDGVMQNLDAWNLEIPSAQPGENNLGHMLCQIKYHEIRMLVTRPSPAIPSPSPDVLTQCYSSATMAIRLYDELYKQDLLAASWTVLHSITMSAITMMYCIRMVPGIADNTTLDTWMGDISICTNLLSAIGEHWSGAKRCKGIIDDLGKATTRLVKSRQSLTSPSNTHELSSDLPLGDLGGMEGDFSTMFGNSDFLLDEFGDISGLFDLTWTGEPSALNSTTTLAVA
ncbi:hypothetical protein PFICI_06715 [Pestalotiopsis fici W106-1]|uniref:Xylanolytic transcriptional activator regulatory domain-containing protein n=1 Tax=Pestalotiopsis fici (strain W106-1 / CGMCC3.15140) TaxID=1229662 RepID=W3X6H2_PESFW|nr:uncharacterized protein PFICI_06715 [Pestalotiopsis fici W106-1]ETS81713.1 hypothetical protein PFICI_06715 [Pestalotiopsis fici W106-1]